MACLSGVVLVNDCDDGQSAVVHQVRFQDCDGVSCYVTRGNSYMIEVDFTPSRDSQTLTARGNTYWFGTPSPLPNVPEDACAATTPTCAIRAGVKHTYAAALAISPEYPLLTTTMQYELLDDGHNYPPPVCFQLDVKILPQ